jgi:hypothetical protein
VADLSSNVADQMTTPAMAATQKILGDGWS